MLTRLSIRNIVLIEALDLDFGRGLGVLTGETGAGKSILLDALGLILGDRAETALVRAGEPKASVSASFEFATLPQSIADALDDADLEIEPGEPLIIRRQVKADGGSKAFVNDQPTSVALLRELASALVELHGQHDDRGLVNPRGHRALLDRYAGIDLAGIERARMVAFTFPAVEATLAALPLVRERNREICVFARAKFPNEVAALKEQDVEIGGKTLGLNFPVGHHAGGGKDKRRGGIGELELLL